MNKPVVTNLRIQKHDWLQIKSMAGELGISVNEYINYLIRDLSIKRELLPHMASNQKIARINAPIWTLGDITKRIKVNPIGQLGSDDALIYE